MKKNGKRAEDAFEEIISRFKKKGYLHRLLDPSDLYGLNDNKLVRTDEKPADYVMVLDGWCCFVEVKATANPKGFPLANVRRPQWSHGVRVGGAGGHYCFLIFRETAGLWYLVPMPALSDLKGVVPWSDLELWLWDTNSTCPLARSSWWTSRLQALRLTDPPSSSSRPSGSSRTPAT
jgi:hypothetical protein